jgi:DNA gyrase/topoisomerase IV subunit A
MLDKKDAQWWILEAQQHPEKAQDLIRLLADRLAFVDRQNEELRAELITLRRKGQSIVANPEVGSLQRRVQELEQTLKQGGNGARHLLIYEKGRLIVSQGLNAAQDQGVGALTASSPLQMLIANASARLYAIGADSRIYTINYNELPAPTDHPITLDAPRDIIAFLDQAAFETQRYLVLVTQGGYAYSVLAATLGRLAGKQEKLIRNALPGDPVIAAFPTNNVDLLALSLRGRWIRIPEKALGGTGSQFFELPKNDRFATLTWISSETTLYFLSADGRLFKRPSSDLPARRVPGKAASALFGDREMVAVGSGTSALALASNGALIPIDLTQLPARAEGENGYALPELPSGGRILAAQFYG